MSFRERCSFCAKPRQAVKKLIAGPAHSICDECVGAASEQVRELDRRELKSNAILQSMRPRSIKQQLDEHVVGQELAKKTLAVAVYNHYKRLVHSTDARATVELGKGNILLLGPTGCGKTLLAETVAKIVDVPFAHADATPLTQAGYVGEDVEGILKRLIAAAKGNIARAQQGIIFLDEVDKIAARTSSQRDVSGEGVQQSLLKMLEGRVVQVTMGDGPSAPKVQVDTANVLFICGGAFTGLDAIRRHRTHPGISGFAGKPAAPSRSQVLLDRRDLVEFGMIPEFLGRLPVVIELEGFDEYGLARILIEPRSSLLAQYQKLLRLSGCTLEVPWPGAFEIGKRALARGTGARGLRAVMEELLLDVLYDAPARPGLHVILDRDDVLRGVPTIKQGG